jgi:hypothetical protein
MFFKKILWSFQGSSFRFLVSRPDDVVFCPDAHQSATSVRTTRTFHSDAHQCLKASNSSILHPSGRNGKSSRHSSEFEKIPVFQRIHPDDVVIPSGAVALQKLDVNFKCTCKCTNRLQLMDCKWEVDPSGNCVFEEQFCF